MSISTNGDYLHRCLALHGKLTEFHYRRRQDLRSVERAAEKIRSSKSFKYEDLETIINPAFWDGADFWRWPSREEIEIDLKNGVWDFWNIPKNEVSLLERLVTLFRFIEPVSVILRFVVPKDYGIFSAPVMKVLEVRRGNSLVETYGNYLADLRELRDEKGFKSAAEIDMALWVLQFGVLEGRLPGQERAELLEAFEADAHLRAIRVRNLSDRLFKDFTRVQLAEALQPVNRALAAQLAGIEFEAMVRRCWRGKVHDKDLYKIIEQLDQQGRIDTHTKGYWHHARRTRNRAMHDQARLDDRAVLNLISEITEPRTVKDTVSRRR